MKDLFFTVDVDRDVNIQIAGEDAAGSLDRGSGTSPRFSSSERGLGLLLDILDDIGMKATFFFEGRTAEVVDCARASGHCIGIHGYDHEDLTLLPDDRLDEVVSASFDAVSDNVGVPVCSRAPYMNADGRVLGAFRSAGLFRDSSLYTSVGRSTEPFMIDDTIELPVPKAKDAHGKIIAAYLWPMHEGRRILEDYTDMAVSIDGPMVLADHSWHMAETREGGVMDPEQEKRAAEQVCAILEGLIDAGYKPRVLSDLDRLGGRGTRNRLDRSRSERRTQGSFTLMTEVGPSKA